MCLNEVSLANLQRILNFLSLRNLLSNEIFFSKHVEVLCLWELYMLFLVLVEQGNQQFVN
ncbi:hypothetical protein CS399_04275 [Fusobacterium vincentii]|nr:hypothetical protein CS399_04275 [Fusobacterium vincentii]